MESLCVVSVIFHPHHFCFPYPFLLILHLAGNMELYVGQWSKARVLTSLGVYSSDRNIHISQQTLGKMFKIREMKMHVKLPRAENEVEKQKAYKMLMMLTNKYLLK